MIGTINEACMLERFINIPSVVNILDFIPIMIALISHEEAKRSNDESDDAEKEKGARKIDIKRVFLSDLMLLLNHNHTNCR